MVTFFGIVVCAIEGKIFKMVNLAGHWKSRTLSWVCVMFLVAVLENVRVYVKLVEYFGTLIEYMCLQHLV